MLKAWSGKFVFQDELIAVKEAIQREDEDSDSLYLDSLNSLSGLLAVSKFDNNNHLVGKYN